MVTVRASEGVFVSTLARRRTEWKIAVPRRCTAQKTSKAGLRVHSVRLVILLDEHHEDQGHDSQHHGHDLLE